MSKQIKQEWVEAIALKVALKLAAQLKRGTVTAEEIRKARTLDDLCIELDDIECERMGVSRAILADMEGCNYIGTKKGNKELETLVAKELRKANLIGPKAK